MSVVTKKGTFSFPSGTSNFPVTGVGFQPNIVLFWATSQTATGYGDDKSLSLGWAVSSSQRGCLSMFSDDNVAVGTSNGAAIHNNFCIRTITTASSIVSTINDADFVSMDADGFTIDPINTPGQANVIVHYYAIGGLSNAFAGTFNTPTTATSQAFTGVGFQPDLLLLLSYYSGTIPRADTGNKLVLGAATSVADQHVSAVVSSNAVPPVLGMIQKSGEIIHNLNAAGTDHTVGDLTSMDSDGFTINFSVVPSTARGFLALALKLPAGGDAAVVSDTQKTSTGTQSKSGLGFQPAGLLTFGGNRAASSSFQADLASFSFGASDGTNQGSTWVGSVESNPTDENAATLTDKILRHASSPSTTDAEASLSSFDSDGYTLDWTTADGTAREFISVAIGNPPASPPASESILFPRWVW